MKFIEEKQGEQGIESLTWLKLNVQKLEKEHAPSPTENAKVRLMENWTNYENPRPLFVFIKNEKLFGTLSECNAGLMKSLVLKYMESDGTNLEPLDESTFTINKQMEELNINENDPQDNDQQEDTQQNETDTPNEENNDNNENTEQNTDENANENTDENGQKTENVDENQDKPDDEANQTNDDNKNENEENGATETNAENAENTENTDKGDDAAKTDNADTGDTEQAKEDPPAAQE